MKKIYIIISILFLSFLTGCDKNNVENLEQNLSKMELSGNLVTLETYYHNVAELEKEAGSGILHWFEKDRKLWIEYTGTVKLGIDMSKVKINTKGNKITVFIPKAEMIGEPGVLTEDFNENSFIYSEDGIINKNKITAEDAAKAMAYAQKATAEKVQENTHSLKLAQMRAKNLIEEYINQFSGISKDAYTINWKYEEI